MKRQENSQSPSGKPAKKKQRSSYVLPFRSNSNSGSDGKVSALFNAPTGSLFGRPAPTNQQEVTASPLPLFGGATATPSVANLNSVFQFSQPASANQQSETAGFLFGTAAVAPTDGTQPSLPTGLAIEPNTAARPGLFGTADQNTQASLPTLSSNLGDQENDPAGEKEVKVSEHGKPIKQESGSENTGDKLRPSSKPIANSSNVEMLDPRGDLTITAGRERVMFRVCSRALARSSPAWAAMLFGPFSEGRGQQGTADWRVELPDDDPKALRIVLGAIHWGHDRTPVVLQQETLFSLTVLCDKYDLLALFKLFWKGWVEKLDAASKTREGFVHRLWIAYALGYQKHYRTALGELICRITTLPGEDGLFLEGCDSENLCDDVHFQALGETGT